MSIPIKLTKTPLKYCAYESNVNNVNKLYMIDCQPLRGKQTPLAVILYTHP